MFSTNKDIDISKCKKCENGNIKIYDSSSVELCSGDITTTNNIVTNLKNKLPGCGETHENCKRRSKL